jgi:hypothetical protein
MAKHLIPDLDSHSLTDYVNDRRLRPWAEQAAALLSTLPQLRVWEVQYKGQGVANTLAVGLASRREPFLLNFTMIPSNLNVEFRFSQYLPQHDFERLKWQNSSWRYADLKTYGARCIQEIIELYLTAIRSNFDAGRLKQGGQSFAEKIIQRALEEIFPGVEILPNRNLVISVVCLALEFDLYLPKLNLAIEIQGPQHFQEVYGCNARLQENDQYKKNWCNAKHIKLVWMNWEGITKGLLQLPLAQRLEQFKRLLNRFLASEHQFLWWKDVNAQQWE